MLSRWATALAEGATPFANERGYAPLNGPARRCAGRAVVGLRSGRARLADVKILLGSLPRGCFPPRRKEAVRKEVGAWSRGEVTPGELVDAGVDVEQLLAVPLRAALLVAFAGKDGRERIATHLAALLERHGPEVLEREATIALTTAHGAKGREARLVVIDLEAPRQVLRGLGSPGAIESERQLLYVAVTRTRGELLLVRHGRRDLGVELGLRRPSARVPETVRAGHLPGVLSRQDKPVCVPGTLGQSSLHLRPGSVT